MTLVAAAARSGPWRKTRAAILFSRGVVCAYMLQIIVIILYM
jgi:hypothetical protein